MKTESDKPLERINLTPEELDALMPKGDSVHTLVQAGSIFIGADWDRSDILIAAKNRGAELAGEHATAMKHGAVIWNELNSPVFVATK